ncbi:hypothetical protein CAUPRSCDRAFT_11305 [Caulochytrium protostelioides]|uniref:Uncharacterized protein n=1 Tax=Caulochytrium protostelioides TaxID=1555241 RepID=A0A4P9WXE1_9FUNG|nr:hypothetical protein CAUPRSCDRAFT_11305 [Caulochytrium protostelioides]
MQWSDWAGPLASLVLALAGTVTAGPILGSSAANMHQQLDRRDEPQKPKSLNSLPNIVRETFTVAVIGNDQLPEPKDSKVLLIRTSDIGKTQDLFIRRLATFYTSEVEKEFQQARDKDTCVPREDAKQNPKQAFIHAATLYQNLWRTKEIIDSNGVKNSRRYHLANISCMYYQMRAVGKLVWKDDEKTLPSPKSLYPYATTIELAANAEFHSKFIVNEMPCAKESGKLAFKINAVECTGLRKNFTDPNKGWFETDGGRTLSPKRGLLEKGAAQTKDDLYNPGRPSCIFATSVPWKKELKFEAKKKTVPNFESYETTFFVWNMVWSDNFTQTIPISLYPASACDA